MNLGIDLGTTYSMIAHVNAFGHPALFPDLNDAGQFRTASAVYLGPQGCLIGAAADDLLEEVPDAQVARFVKSLLTRPDFRYGDHQGREWNAIGLSALILRKLLRDASVFAGEDIGTTVLTVPAQFTDEQRRATRAAGMLAGLEDVRLVEEPVAAAAYYGQEEGDADRTLLVYDFGGGTLDVTLLQTSPHGLFVLASDGDAALGGRHIDQAIMELTDAEMQSQIGVSPLADLAAAQRLRRVAEEAKISLSRPGGAGVRRSVLLMGQPWDFTLSRSQLDDIARPAVARSIAACERCLSQAGLDWRDIDKVMMTGGSSLLPQAAQAVSASWGRPASELALKQPHQAVAFGAAILSQRFAGDPGAHARLRQVATADLCLRVRDPQSGAPALETLIARNTPLPAACRRTVYTSRADQAQVTLEFVQVRGEGAAETSLGRFSFGPILAPRADYPVDLEISCNAEGLVRVTAVDPLTGRSIDRVLQEDSVGAIPIESQRPLVASVSLGAY